jgi:D-lactate dehydrogenase (cytochrome)
MMSAINTAGTVSSKLPAVDTLFFKIQGSPSSIEETANLVKLITKRHKSSRFAFAKSDEEADELWQNRKEALFATLASEPGTRCWTTDVW